MGRSGRCEKCQTKFVIEETVLRKSGAAAPRSVIKKSNKSVLCLLLIVAVAAGSYGAYTQFAARQLSDRRDTVVNKQPEPAEVVETPIKPVAQTNKELVSTQIPKGLPAFKESFAVKTQFGKIDIREYQETYPNVAQGWMPNSKEESGEAKSWGNYLGPLGVRIRSHAPQLQGRPAFAANVPLSIQDAAGELALTAAEVIQVAPGSPADQHLQLGDLIIGIEGEMLQSGNQYRPDWHFMHKDARELQLMFGEKIDQAQARGDIQLTVLRFPAGTGEPLPVHKKELWSGKGGNQSATGLQTFDIAVPGEGFITLESNQFDDNIAGDGAIWLDVTVQGDYGTKPLLSMTPESARAGYGSPQFTSDKPYSYQGKDYAQSLALHAQGAAKWLLPPGTKSVKGSFAAMSYGQVQPKVYYTNLALPLSGAHQAHTVELRFPIGKTGSFSATYPKDCPKTQLTVTRHTEWLAAQQRDDGSWPRLAGYTGEGWDTAWCALALMSSGETKYDAQVKKAAYRLAYADAPSEWIAERAMRLILLSEYYLRTNDAQIVAGIQAAYYQTLDCCKTDYMSGHKVNGFGYGIAGQHYGTGHLALSMALASRTPITFNKTLVDNIIRHAGEVCVNGTYAYGRGRRMARDDSREHSGGNAMSGSGMLGVQIGGGHLISVKEFVERMDASIGDGDNSHATSSLAFIFSSLAIAVADESVFLKHMQNFRYKMTLDDNWEGGFLKSAFPLDFQGGEGVTSNWIRSAGSILVLNALKKNLAITGKKEFWNKQAIPTTAVSEWGGQVHSYYLRNWCLVKELLGKDAPQGIDQGIKELHALSRTLELVPKTRELVAKMAPALIDAIAKNTTFTELQRAYAIELLCGLDIKIYTVKKGDKQQIDVEIVQPLHELNWLDSDKASMYEKSPFPLRTKVEIAAANIAEVVLFETDGTKDFDLDQGVRKLSVATPLKDAALEKFDGVAKIAFKIGATTVTYRRPLKFNAEFSHSNNFNLRRLKLKLKMAPRAYFQSQPLVIAGIPFDCMYPAERMLDVKGPADGSSVNIHEGDEVIVDLASENFICPWVHTLEFEKPTQVTVFKAQQQRDLIGSMKGNIDDLYDFNRNTFCELVSQQTKNIIEYDFGKEVTLNGLDANYGGSCFIRIWYKNGENWTPLVWDNYSVDTSHHPVFPDTKATLWRLEFHHGGNLKLQTLRFYHNPNMVVQHPRLPQMDDVKFLPPVQPE